MAQNITPSACYSLYANKRAPNKEEKWRRGKGQGYSNMCFPIFGMVCCLIIFPVVLGFCSFEFATKVLRSP